MYISEDVKYIGVNDHKIDLFEGIFSVPNGMSYNSYLIFDEKIAVIDTVDKNFTEEWLENIKAELKGRKPDYLVVHHVEPDHSASIKAFFEVYPETVIVSSRIAFDLIKNFYGNNYEQQRIVVKEGESLPLGEHSLTFFFAPMVHWPEVIVSYESCEKLLFSADAFGKFGALDVEEDWLDEGRRYYCGIVGKYGMQVQALLKKAAKLDIAKICPLHGPVLSENLGYYINLYDIWSSHRAEEEGVMIAYTTVYGNTKAAVELMAEKLKEKGCKKVVVHDLARCDMSVSLADAFRFNKIILATTTYNADIFPFMRDFANKLALRKIKNRTIGLIENGSWVPAVEYHLKNILAPCENLCYCENIVRILSSMKEENKLQMDALAEEIMK